MLAEDDETRIQAQNRTLGVDPARTESANNVRLANRLLELAELRLLSGDEAAYHQTARQLSDRFELCEDPLVANQVAWVWCLGPHDATDLSPIVQTVNAQLSNVTQKPRRHELLNTLGALLYRADKYDEAIVTLTESINTHGSGGIIEDWLFLSMAHRRSDREDDADRWLEQARVALEKMRQVSKLGQRHRAVSPWSQIPIQEHLFREAESLSKSN